MMQGLPEQVGDTSCFPHLLTMVLAALLMVSLSEQISSLGSGHLLHTQGRGAEDTVPLLRTPTNSRRSLLKGVAVLRLPFLVKKS